MRTYELYPLPKNDGIDLTEDEVRLLWNFYLSYKYSQGNLAIQRMFIYWLYQNKLIKWPNRPLTINAHSFPPRPTHSLIKNTPSLDDSQVYKSDWSKIHSIYPSLDVQVIIFNIIMSDIKFLKRGRKTSIFFEYIQNQKSSGSSEFDQLFDSLRETPSSWVLSVFKSLLKLYWKRQNPGQKW